MYINYEAVVMDALEKIANGSKPAIHPSESESIIDRADETLAEFFVRAYPTRIGQIN